MIQAKMWLRMVFLLLACSLVSASLYAEQLLFKINQPDNSVTAFRFRIDGQSWKVREAEQHIIELMDFNTDNDVFSLQQYTSTGGWGPVFSYRFDIASQRWVLLDQTQTEKNYENYAIESSLSLGIYAVVQKSSSSVEHLYSFSYGLGLQGFLPISFARRLITVFDVQTQYARSNNLWTDSFLLVNASVGFGYQIDLNEIILILPTLSYGVFLHNCEESLSGTLQRSWYVDQQLQGSMLLIFPISKAIQGTIRVNATLLMENEKIGILYGLGGGIHFGGRRSAL